MSHKQPSRWILVSTHYMRTSWSPNINRTMLKHTEAKTLQYIERMQCFAQMNDIVKFLLENQVIYSLDFWNIITKLLSCLWLRINWGFLLDGQKAQWLYGPLMSDIFSCVRMYVAYLQWATVDAFFGSANKTFQFPWYCSELQVHLLYTVVFTLKKHRPTISVLILSEVKCLTSQVKLLRYHQPM